MKQTINLKQDNEKKEIKDNIKKTEKNLIGNKQLKKTFGKTQNTGAFRNNYKNYQYDYEEDFYEPY